MHCQSDHCILRVANFYLLLQNIYFMNAMCDKLVIYSFNNSIKQMLYCIIIVF